MDDIFDHYQDIENENIELALEYQDETSSENEDQSCISWNNLRLISWR